MKKLTLSLLAVAVLFLVNCTKDEINSDDKGVTSEQPETPAVSKNATVNGETPIDQIFALASFDAYIGALAAYQNTVLTAYNALETQEEQDDFDQSLTNIMQVYESDEGEPDLADVMTIGYSNVEAFNLQFMTIDAAYELFKNDPFFSQVSEEDFNANWMPDVSNEIGSGFPGRTPPPSWNNVMCDNAMPCLIEVEIYYDNAIAECDRVHPVTVLGVESKGHKKCRRKEGRRRWLGRVLCILLHC